MGEQVCPPETNRHQNYTPSNRHRVIQRHAPAINHHNFAGDVAGCIAGQKGYGVGNRRRFAESLHRGTAHDFGFGFVTGQHDFGGEFGGVGAGGYGVHANANARQRQRRHAGELVDAALAAFSLAIVGIVITALTELMLMMLPREVEPLKPVRASALAITRATAWTTRNELFRWMRSTASKSA